MCQRDQWFNRDDCWKANQSTYAEHSLWTEALICCLDLPQISAIPDFFPQGLRNEALVLTNPLVGTFCSSSVFSTWKAKNEPKLRMTSSWWRISNGRQYVDGIPFWRSRLPLLNVCFSPLMMTSGRGGIDIYCKLTCAKYSACVKHLI